GLRLGRVRAGRPRLRARAGTPRARGGPALVARRWALRREGVAGMRWKAGCCALLLAWPVAAPFAQDAAVPAIVDHEAVVVSGVVSGPGLWKVRKGGHAMHVMATLSPMPRRMQWESAGVEAALAASTQV